MNNIVTETERWLPVPGYEGLYEVSDHGRVKSLARRCRVKSPGTRTLPERILKAGLWSGYPLVILCRDGERKTMMVHVLVMLVFVGDRPTPCHHICHGDDVRANNHLSNLRYGTAKENRADCRANGRDTIGSRHGLSKLNESQVADILRIGAMGATQKSLGESFGVTPKTIRDILHRRAWTHVQI